MGAYDDIIRELPQTSEVAPGAPSQGPYADVIREMGEDATQGAQGANIAGADAKPDAAGRAAELSRSLGTPASVIESALPDFERVHRIATNEATLRENPVLARWAAANTQAVRIAHDDFDRLDMISKTITAARHGFDQGELSDQLSRVGYAQMMGGPEAQLYWITDAERQLRERLSRPEGVDGTFYNMVKGVSGFLGGLYSMSKRPAYMALGGAAVGTAVPAVGTAIGAGAGFVAGMVREGFETGAGSLYNTLKNERDRDGNPLHPDIVRGASLSGGTILGLLNAMNVGAAGKPFVQAAESIIPALARKIVERPTVGLAASRFAMGLAKSGATGAAFGAMSEATTIAAETMAKELDSGAWDTALTSEPERAKAIDRIASSAADMVLNFGVLHVPARGIGLLGDVSRARESARQRSFIDALADGSVESKLRERSPSTFERFIANQTDGTPVEELFIPAEQVLKLYQDANTKPGASDHLFPFVKDMDRQLEQAQPVNGDVVIKTSDYAAYLAGTEVDGKLRDHIKVGPDAMSMDEAKNFLKDYKKELGDQAEGLKAELGKPQESDDKIRTEVQKQLTDVGYKERTAGGMAAQMAAFFRTIGRRIGIDPYELFQKYGLNIKRPELQERPEGALEQEKRGYVSFGTDRKVSIALLEKADLSTFLHESGHMYLEVLRDLTKEAGSSDLHSDMEAIRAYLGVKPGEDIQVKHHEKFARSFEAYLMEGKAPSKELRGAFARFRQWLTTIYSDITGLGVRLTDEVRGVFDRMLASGDEIANARRAERLEALFTDAKEAGMTDQEFNAYKRSIRRMSQDADEKLIQEVMKDVRRERTAEWKREERGVRAQMEKVVDMRPEVAAKNLLDTGKVKIGKDFTMDDLADRVGAASGDALQKSMDALNVQAELAGKPDPRRMLIDQATKDHMMRVHGDSLADGSIRDEAISVLHSKDQAEILAVELRALGRTAKRPPMPYQVARDWAREQIADKKIMDATREWKYARDEAKAARATERALLAGDRAEAYRQKQLQLLNHVLYMEARDAHGEVDAGGRLLDRYARAESVKNLDQGYLDQIHGLLERFDFKSASGPELARRASLRDWINEQEADGEEVKIPDRYRDEAFKKNYTELTMDEFRGLVDSVENIAHIGRLKATLLDLSERRDFQEVVTEAVDAVGQLRQRAISEKRNPGEGGKGFDRVDAKFLRAGVMVRSLDAALLKMEQVFDWLDSANPRGVFNRIVFRRIADAQVREDDMRTRIMRDMRNLNAKMPPEFRRDFNERYEVPELLDSRTGKPSQLLKREIIAIALNTGNASSHDKLLRGEGWKESSVQAVLDRHMTKADWDFVSGIGKIMESLWPEIEAMEKRMSGVAPAKVDVRSVKTKFGDIDGWYYPLIYDPLRSPDVELQRQRSASALFENNYQRATTPHGYTIERKQMYARPLYLSLDVIPRHLTQVTHDLAYREAVMDADRFLSNREVRGAVENTLGREVYQQFRPWLQAIANDRVYDERGLAFWDKAAHGARTTATMVGLGFRLTTMLIHGLTAASNSIGELGPRWMASGMGAFFGTPEKMVAAKDFIFDRSGEMRNRMGSIDRDVRDGLRDLEGKNGIVYAARRFAYYGISALDMGSALPTWMGAYNKALHEGMVEQDAIYAADKSVRVAHGAGNVKDLPAIQRGSEFQKLFTMFYSFWSHFYNRQRDLARRTGEAGSKLAEGNVQGAARDFSMVLARSVFYFVLPQMIHAGLRSKGREEEDKSFGTLAAEEIGLGFFAGIPVVRDVAHAAFLGKDYEATPAAQIVKSFAASAKDLTAALDIRDAEVSDRWVRHAVETAGYTFGLPLGQPAGTVQFLWDVMRGETSPEDLRSWLHGIIYGKLPPGE